MILDELGTYLQSAGIGTIGTDLYLGEMTQDPSTTAITVIYEYPGAPIDRSHTEKIDMSRVQFQTRAGDYMTARAKIWQIFNATEMIKNVTLSGVWYQSVQAIQAPAFINRDVNNRPIFSFNAQVMKAFS